MHLKRNHIYRTLRCSVNFTTRHKIYLNLVPYPQRLVFACYASGFLSFKSWWWKFCILTKEILNHSLPWCSKSTPRIKLFCPIVYSLSALWEVVKDNKMVYVKSFVVLKFFQSMQNFKKTLLCLNSCKCLKDSCFEEIFL